MNCRACALSIPHACCPSTFKSFQVRYYYVALSTCSLERQAGRTWRSVSFVSLYVGVAGQVPGFETSTGSARLVVESGACAYKEKRRATAQGALVNQTLVLYVSCNDFANWTKIYGRLDGCIMGIQVTRWMMRLGGTRPESNCRPAEPRRRGQCTSGLIDYSLLLLLLLRLLELELLLGRQAVPSQTPGREVAC